MLYAYHFKVNMFSFGSLKSGKEKKKNNSNKKKNEKNWK